MQEQNREPTDEQDSEAQLGGADAVEKTTYVVGSGSDPHAKPRGAYVAATGAGGGNRVAWAVVVVAVIVMLVYALGVGR